MEEVSLLSRPCYFACHVESHKGLFARTPDYDEICIGCDGLDEVIQFEDREE